MVVEMSGVGGVVTVVNFSGGVDPDDCDQSDDSQCDVGVVEGQRDRDEVEAEGYLEWTVRLYFFPLV